MGIRVSKAIGYGTDTVQTTEDGYGIRDSRIDAPKFWALMDAAHSMGHRAFLDWLDQEKPNLVAFQNKHHPSRDATDDKLDDFDFQFLRQSMAKPHDKEFAKKFRLGDSIIWQGEYGIGKVMLFVPVTMPELHRYDDPIDYCEETEKEQLNHYRFLRGSGIYPWQGRMVRTREPGPGVLKEGADSTKYKYMDALMYSRLVGTWRKDAPPQLAGEALRHFKEDYRPVIPIDVTCILWFFRQAFLDLDRFYNSLRPMLYVWWG